MPLYVPFVEPEGKFINVAAKVLFAGVMIDADQATFENRENALDAVCCHGLCHIREFYLLLLSSRREPGYVIPMP